jgi:hypothetical protein
LHCSHVCTVAIPSPTHMITEEEIKRTCRCAQRIPRHSGIHMVPVYLKV